MKTVKGNLISMAMNDEFDIIVHGCNCFHTMGAGIAYEIAKRCPSARDIDFKTVKGDKKKLGTISAATCPRDKDGRRIKPFVVVNAYTQFNPGPDFRQEALEGCLQQIKKNFGGQNFRFGFPMIGAGIGGGDWGKIQAAIISALRDENVTVVEFDGSK